MNLRNCCYIVRRIYGNRVRRIELTTHEIFKQGRRERRHPVAPQDFRSPDDHGDVLHGCRGAVRTRRYHTKNGLRRHDADPCDHAAALEPADCDDGQRAGHRDTGGGRILHLGAAWHGAFLGISGNVAHACGQRVRDGALPESLHRVHRTVHARNCLGPSRTYIRICDDRAVHGLEHLRRSSGR